MKDRQIQSQGAQPSVPLLSPVLHWLAVPAIVYLRSGFGFSFLSPKSVFLSFVWATVLFFIYAWLERGAWDKNWAIALFAGGASALYVIHLLAAFNRETRKQGKHDFYSGTSHLLCLPGFSQNRGNARFETVLHLWIEPALVCVAATALRGFMGEHRLSFWLLIVAAALWLKEFINYWYGLRSEKKHGDIIEDAEEKMPAGGTFAEAPLPSAGDRKPRKKHAPSPASDAAEKAREQRYAEVLRLMPPHPPYDLQQAEHNYRHLMKAFHPDKNPANHEKAAELTEAIDFFRRILSI